MKKTFLKLTLSLFILSAIALSSCGDNSESSITESSNFSEDTTISSENSLFTESSICESLEESFEESSAESKLDSTEFSEETSNEDETSEISEESSADDVTSEILEESSTDNTTTEFSEESSTDSTTSDISNETSEEYHTGFKEPEGKTYTTEKGNKFETNCTDTEALSIMHEIADIASQYNKTTVYYTDVNQKYYFAFGANNIHNTASTIKAPYASYLMKSGVDLSEILTLEKRHIFTGSGVLKNAKVGNQYSVGDLIRYMITRSDNTAYAMLIERFGTKGFREYSQSLGLDFKLPSGGYTTCTIREMATFLLDIYQYKNTERGSILINHMKNCSYSLQIPKAVSHPVAHKFGFIYEGKAFHDMGIVFAPSPYIELIFTKIDGTVYDTKAFLTLGKLVESLNKTLSEKY